jgi:hypothetical protein
MRLRSRIGAVSLAAALSFSGSLVAFADDTPGAQRAGVTQQNTAVIHVEGMT